MKVNLPVIFAQGDDRWGLVFLGFNTKLPFNIKNYGCLDSCLAMIARYFGKDVDPLSMNDLLKEKKGFAANSGEYIWGSITKCFSDITEARKQTPSLLTDAQVQEIKTALDGGFPVMCQVDYNPKTDQPDMHFVVFVDYDPNDENNFTIADPINGKIRSLKDYLGWWKPNARKTIEQYIIYKGKKPVESAGKVLVEKQELSVLSFIKEQWLKLVAYLEVGGDPISTPFESIQSVIKGIKSRQTDLENQLNLKDTELKKANTEIANRIDQIANINTECQRVLKVKDAEYKALKEAYPDISKLKGQYEGTISDLQGTLREAQKQGGIKDLRITELETQLNAEMKAENFSIGELILAVLKKLLPGKGGEKK